MPKGGDIKHRQDGIELSFDPPESLVSDSERKAWHRLRSDLARVGGSHKCDSEQVALLARRIARAEMLSIVANQLVSPMLGEKIHPILSELRALESGIQSSLGSMNLTPRSRSVSRSGSAMAQDASRLANDEQKELLNEMP